MFLNILSPPHVLCTLIHQIGFDHCAMRVWHASKECLCACVCVLESAKC